jgi:hypothetical protein
VLVYATWPVYLLAWVLACLRLPLGFRPTPKSMAAGVNPVWLLPQVAAVVLIGIGAAYTVIVEGHAVSLLLSFALAQGLLQLILLLRWLHLEVRLRRSAARTALVQTTTP